MSKVLLAIALAGCTTSSGATLSSTDSSLSGVTIIQPATGYGADGVTDHSSLVDQSTSLLGVSWCCTTWFVPIQADVGDTVSSISAPIRDNATTSGHAGNNVLLELITQVSNGSGGVTTTVLGSSSTSGTGTTTTQSIALTHPHVMAVGESLLVEAIALAGGALPGPATYDSWIGPITVTSGGPVHTLIIPVLPAKTASVELAQWSAVGGQGSASHWAYIPLSTTVGTTIVSLRARVEDAGSGTTLRERLLSMSDSNESFTVIATSPSSSGSGLDETLSIPGPIVTAAYTQYVVEVGNSANPNNLDSKLFRLELDVSP